MYDAESWFLRGDLYKCPVLSSGRRMMMMMTTKYTGYKITKHCSGTRELSVPRLLTYIVQRWNIKNAFDFNLFGVVHVVTHKGGTKDISHSSLDFLIIANKGKSKVHIIFANLARNKFYCIEN